MIPQSQPDQLGSGTLSHDLIPNLLDAISDSFYILDSEWRFTYANAQTGEFFNIPPATLIGKNFWEIFPLALGSVFDTEYRRAVREKQPVKFTTLSVSQPGRWVDIRAFPTQTGLAVYQLDVTIRELAVAALRSNEAQLQLIIDAAPALISYVGKDCRYRLVNKTYERWFQNPKSDIVGHTLLDILGQKTWDIVGPKITQALAGETVTFEAEALYKNGAPRWIRGAYTPDCDPSGRVQGVVSLVTDISDLKRAEHELRESEAYHRSIFESAGVANSEADPATGKLLRVNRKFCELTGYSADELIGRMTFFDLTHPDDRERDRLTMQPFLRGETESYQIEKRYLRKNGKVVWIHLTATIIHQVNGKPARVLGVAQDISERKQAEEDLRQAVEELRQINEAAPVAIWVARDPSCQVITGNSTGHRIFEAEPQENLSKGAAVNGNGEARGQSSDPRQYFDAKGRALPVSELPMQRAILQNCEVRDQVITMILPSGHEKTILGSAAPLRDRDGSVRGCVSAFMDITARVAAEQALREREEYLRLAASASGIGYWSWDLRSGVCNLDPICANFFDLESTPHVNQVLNRMFQNDRRIVLERIQAAIHNAQSYRVDFRVVTNNKPVRWLIGLGAVERDEHGTPLRMYGVNIDISERKAAEEEKQTFVSLIENSSDFIALCDMNKVVFFVNEAGLQMTGLKDMEEARHIPVADYFFPEDREFIFEHFFPQVLRDGRAETEVRFRNFKTGQARWMLYNVFTVRNADGETAGLATVSRDITERKKTEQFLKEADHRKDEFLATLAHELRNPLAPISNALQIWHLVEQDSTKAYQIRQMMERQVRQLERLIDDLLDVSRISRGKIELQREKIDLESVIERAVEAVTPFISSCGHTLTVLKPAAPITLQGDSGRLQQVFGNLLHNAAKYTDKNGHIQVSLSQQDSLAEISERDNGSGIPQEMLLSIFDAFTQVNHNLDRAHGGLGIGLTLVKTLVEMHGGSVVAKSDGPGKGSEFIVRLPTVASAAAAAPEGTREQITKVTPAKSLDRHRVLIVDDLKASADTFALILEGLGQDTRIAYDGPSALEIVRSFHPEIIFSDIAMPGMDGYRLAQLIREATGAAPTLVALTGFGQAHDREQALRSGFNQHLVKPASLEAVRKVLSNGTRDANTAPSSGP